LRATLSLIALVLSIFVSACTSQQVYDSAQGWRQNECNRLMDHDERDRCMETATMSYDTYKKQVEEDKDR
jgi:type III secretory pathway component EscR